MPSIMIWKTSPPPRTNKLPPQGATRIQRRTDRGGDERKAGTGEEKYGGH